MWSCIINILLSALLDTGLQDEAFDAMWLNIEQIEKERDQGTVYISS